MSSGDGYSGSGGNGPFGPGNSSAGPSVTTWGDGEIPDDGGGGNGSANEAEVAFPKSYIIMLGVGGGCCLLITCVWIYCRDKRSDDHNFASMNQSTRDYSNSASNSGANPPRFTRDSWITTDNTDAQSSGHVKYGKYASPAGSVGSLSIKPQVKAESWLDKYRYPETPSDSPGSSGASSQYGGVSHQSRSSYSRSSQAPSETFQNESRSDRASRQWKEKASSYKYNSGGGGSGGSGSRRGRNDEHEMNQFGQGGSGYLDAETIPGQVSAPSIADDVDMPDASDTGMVSMLRQKLTRGEIDRDEYEQMRAVMLRAQAAADEDDHIAITAV